MLEKGFVESLFLKHNKYVSLFSFRHYPELVAAEIVLEAYQYPKNLKTTSCNLKMDSMTLGSHKAFTVHICTSPYRLRDPLHMDTCRRLLMLWQRVHPSNSISKPGSVAFSLNTQEQPHSRGQYLFPAENGADKKQACSKYACSCSRDRLSLAASK